MAYVGVPGHAEAAHGIAQSARWFASLTMTLFFVVMFVVDAWRPSACRAMLKQRRSLRNQRDGSLHSP